MEPRPTGTGVSSLGYPGRLLVALSHALFEVDFSYSLSLLKLSRPARRLSVQWSLWRGCDVWLKPSRPARRLSVQWSLWRGCDVWLKPSRPARRLFVQWSLSRGCDVYLKLSGPARRLTTKKTRCISSDTHALICATYQGAFCV